ARHVYVCAMLCVGPPATTALSTLSLHDALPISGGRARRAPGAVAGRAACAGRDRHRAHPRTRRGAAPAADHRRLGADAVDRVARSEEHTSELQSRENVVCRLLPEKKTA